MKLKSIVSAIVLGLWTAFTLAGSIWGFIVMGGPNSVARSNIFSSANIAVDLIAALSIYLCGGGLWGLGIARLMNADAKSIVQACALSWSATVFTFLIVVVLLALAQ